MPRNQRRKLQAVQPPYLPLGPLCGLVNHMVIRNDYVKTSVPAEFVHLQSQPAAGATLFVGVPGAMTAPLPAFPAAPTVAGVPQTAIAQPGVVAPLGAALPAQGFAAMPGAAWAPAASLAAPFAAFPGAALPAYPFAIPLATGAPGAAQAALAQGCAQAQAAVQPGCAVQDLGHEVVCTFEVPGVNAADLSLFAAGSVLTLRAERPAANGSLYLGQVVLPAQVVTNQATARLHNGLLVVTLPKVTATAAGAGHKVPIEA